MRITRSRRFTVNMGEYESFSFGGDVSASHTDLGITDEELVNLTDEELAEVNSELYTYVMETLEDIEREDAKQAAEFTSNKSSFILDILGPPPEAPRPKKVRRRGNKTDTTPYDADEY